MQKKIFLLTILVVLGFTLPDSFSWGNQNGRSFLGAVTNQNNPHRCESGWAIATTSALSARINIAMNKMNFKSASISLSSQSLLECDSRNFGCLGVFFNLDRGIQPRQ